jgi:hypothetical protein
MLTREILLKQRETYKQGKEQALSQASAYSGAIDAVDHMLAVLAQEEAAARAASDEGDNHA